MVSTENTLRYADCICWKLGTICVITRNDFFVIVFEAICFMRMKLLAEQELSHECAFEKGVRTTFECAENDRSSNIIKCDCKLCHVPKDSRFVSDSPVKSSISPLVSPRHWVLVFRKFSADCYLFTF